MGNRPADKLKRTVANQERKAKLAEKKKQTEEILEVTDFYSVYFSDYGNAISSAVLHLNSTEGIDKLALTYGKKMDPAQAGFAASNLEKQVRTALGSRDWPVIKRIDTLPVNQFFVPFLVVYGQKKYLDQLDVLLTGYKRSTCREKDCLP